MKRDVIHGPWRRFKIQLRKTWSELTDEELKAISPGGDDLVQMVQHRFGCERDEATKPPRNLERDFLATMVRLRLPVSASPSKIEQR
jgi:uncharacterized protein YjbJ (UPF0337 family)